MRKYVLAQYLFILLTLGAMLLYINIYTEALRLHVLYTSSSNTDQVFLTNLTNCVATVFLLGGADAKELVPHHIQALQKIKRGLQKTPDVDLYCLLDDTASLELRSTVERVGWRVHPVTRVSHPAHTGSDGRYFAAGTYTKLHLWNLTQCHQVLYLDLDTVPLRAVGNLLHGHQPGMLGVAVDSLSTPHVQGERYNTGVMVLTPDPDDYVKLMSSIARIPHNAMHGADQPYLQAFFADRIYELSPSANLMNNDKTKAPEAWSRVESEATVMHFVAKPWSITQCAQDWVLETCLLWFWL
jgi:hypothetical protein